MTQFEKVSKDIMELVPGIQFGIPIPEALELILAEIRRLKVAAGEKLP